jgi:hypothetical protein
VKEETISKNIKEKTEDYQETYREGGGGEEIGRNKS